MTVNHLGGNLNAAGFRVTAGLFDAHGERTDNLGASIGVGRALTETVDASLTYFTSTSGRGPASGSFAATFRETLGPRLTLVQIATHASGQTSLKFGGSFLSNPVAVGIDYQTVYAPFRVGNPFVQAITLHVRVLIRKCRCRSRPSPRRPDERGTWCRAANRGIDRPEAAAPLPTRSDSPGI